MVGKAPRRVTRGSFLADAGLKTLPSDPVSFVNVGGTLFFTADDGVHGRELWRSDGTRAGTVLVKDINATTGFAVASRGTADTRTGELRVQVATTAAGELVVGPDRSSLIETSATRHVKAPGTTEVTLRPTAAGVQKLRHALREARLRGQNTGTVEVTARFTFTSRSGGTRTLLRDYTLQLR